MSDSVRPHRLQPTRLICPWDFLGKNTGMGCHCLLQLGHWEERNVSGKSMRNIRQLPYSNALRHSQPSTQPTCPERAMNNLHIQFNLYFAKRLALAHLCKNKIQEFQTMCSLKLHLPHFILFINGQTIYGCNVKFKEGAVNLAFTAGQAVAHHNKQ